MTDNANTKPPMRRGLRWLLIGSLVFNVVVVGGVVGAMIAFDPHFDDRDDAFLYVRALEDEDRRELGKRIRQSMRGDMHKPHHKRDKSAIRKHYRAVAEAIGAETLDPDALSVLLTNRSDRFTDRRAHVQQIWISYIGEMSQAERQAYAQRILSMVQKHSSKRDKKQ